MYYISIFIFIYIYIDFYEVWSSTIENCINDLTGIILTEKGLKISNQKIGTNFILNVKINSRCFYTFCWNYEDPVWNII